jgi:hypothetical protein
MPALNVLGATAPGTNPPLTAADFEAANVRDMAAMRDKVITAMKPLSASDKSAFATKVCEDFSAQNVGINSKRPEVRLNSAILIHDLGTLSTDRYLEQMVDDADPSVRYWAARGLYDISSQINMTGGLTLQRAVTALSNRGKVETSGIVETEIIKDLIVFQAAGPLLDSLEAVTGQMEAAVPDVAMLQTIAVGLDFINKSMASADKAKAANVAARAASFAVQQEVCNEKVIKANDPAAKVPSEYIGAVQRVVESAVKVANSAAGKTYSLKTASFDELQLSTFDTFGTPGGRAGTLQGDLKTVKVPPKVKNAE